MKKTLVWALIAIGFAFTCNVEASPPVIDTSHEVIVADLSYNLQPTVAIYNFSESFNDVYAVEYLQPITFFESASAENCTTSKTLKDVALNHFSGFVIKPPLCISSKGYFSTASIFSYSGNRWCTIRNPSKLNS